MNLLKAGSYHLLFWLVYSAYEYIIARGYQVNIGQPHAVLIMFGLNIVFFYLFTHVVLAKIAGHLWQDHFALILRIVIWFFAYIGVKIILGHLLGNNLHSGDLSFESVGKLISGQIFRCGHFAFMASIYYFYNKREQERDEKYKLLEMQFRNQLSIKQNHTQVEKNFFLRWRKQFDPHFIFSLFTYLQAKAQPDESDQIVLLARLLQYHTSGATVNKEVKLQEELEHIQLNVQLRALIWRKNISAEILCDIITQQHIICPMLLLPVSNLILNDAFHAGSNFRLVIDIKIMGNKLSIEFKDILLGSNRQAFEAELLPFNHALQTNYGRAAMLRLSDNGASPSVVIQIPIQ